MDWTLFLTYLAACIAAGSTGALFSPGTWYDSLDKPSWTPQNWVFPTVWTALYILMSYTAMRVALVPGTGQALAFWSLQIALNTLWTPVFFGLRKLGTGMFVLACLWLAVAATTVAFFRADWIAGILFAPYLVWVTIAAALNFSVWRRNPGSATA
jgi:tryptophan-rich sensory protein